MSFGGPMSGDATTSELCAWTREARTRAIDLVLATSERPHAALYTALLAAEREDARLDLARALERLPEEGLLVAAGVCLVRGNADVVAYVARALAPRFPLLPEQAHQMLGRALLDAKARLDAPLVNDAIDDALCSCKHSDVLPTLVARLPVLSSSQRERVIDACGALEDERLFEQHQVLIDAAVSDRVSYLALVPVLVRLCSLMGSRRARLVHAGASMLSDPGFSLANKLAVLDVVDAAFSWPVALDVDLLLGLLQVADEARRAVIVALLGRLGTEDAAHALIGLIPSTDLALAADVETVLRSWASPLVDVERSDAAAVGSLPPAAAAETRDTVSESATGGQEVARDVPDGVPARVAAPAIDAGGVVVKSGALVKHLPVEKAGRASASPGGRQAADA